MRHGRRALAVSGLSPATKTNSSFPELRNVLLVASLSKTLSQSGTRSLDSNSIPISEPIVLQILRRNSIDPSKKLDFFKWCFSLRPDYKHSVSAYSQILRTVCRTGLLGEIPDLLISMKEDEVKLDQSTSKVLLDSLIRSGKFDSALGVLDYLEESGENNPSLYDSVIISLVKKHELRLALSIFFKLLEDDDDDDKHSYVPGNVAVNSLLVGLRKSDLRSEFIRVYKKLKSMKEFKLDVYGYNITIHGFGCYGDLDTALCLFNEMNKTKTISPDIYMHV